MNWPSLRLNLPSVVTEEKWDIIIVDSPVGYSNQSPGQFQSLYTSRLLNKNSDVLIVVDDCDGEIKWQFANLFFGKHNLFLVVGNQISWFYGRNLQCYYRLDDSWG